MKNRFVLKGSICYSASPTALHTLAQGYAVCEQGRSLGVFEKLPQTYKTWDVLDYGDALILPGLTDLHVHAPQFSFRALGMDLELLDWLNTCTFPEEAKYSSLAYADTAYAAFVQNMRRGPNTRACVFATAHVPATHLLMDKMEASGLVSMVGKVNMDRNSHPDLQEAGPQESMQDTLDWLTDISGKYSNTTPILTPRFIPSCSDVLMSQLRESQQTYALPVQSHLCENPAEVAWVQELCPNATSYADAYHRFGLFGGAVPTIMAHCVWVTQQEIELMAKQQVMVAHCPQSNMNLSSGIAPVRKFLQANIPTGLGSDVAGGCHTSIFRAMSDAVQTSKLYWRLVDEKDAPLTLEEAFYLGTLGGGSFFGKVGSFAPEYEFDALVIDDSTLAAPFPLSIQQRLARVVYLSDDRHIKAKFVRGSQLF